ncbi:MAG: hypothetical protein ACWA44_02435 [Thiotrichales bacterium]
MAIPCSTTCGAVANLVSYWAACDGNQNLRKHGDNLLVLVKCDLVIADPTDMTLWDAAIAAGNVVLYPVGKIDTPAPSVDTSNDVDACRTNVALRQTYSIEVSTYQVKPDYSDYTFHSDLATGYANWRAFWINCEEAVTMPNDYIDFILGVTSAPLTTNPGFEFSIPTPPNPVEGDGQRTRWVWNMEIERSAGDIFRKALLPGILASVQG